MLPSRLKTRPNSLLKLTAMSLVVATLSGCGEDAKDCGGFWDKTFGREECAVQAKNSISPTKNSQNITDLNMPAMKIGEKITLNAKATSGLTIAYTTKTPNICTVSSAEVTAIAQGECTIEATQAGDDTHLAATPMLVNQLVTPVCSTTEFLDVANNVCKAKAAQTITGLTLPALSVGGKATLAATSNSGLVVSYASQTTAVCTVNAKEVTAIAKGTCTIAANQAGDDTHLAATPMLVNQLVTPVCTATEFLDVVNNVCKAKAAQTITGLALTNPFTVGQSHTLAATSSANFAVSYSSKTTNVCTITDSQVTAIAAGICTVEANQAGDNKTLAAPVVTVSQTVIEPKVSGQVADGYLMGAKVFWDCNNNQSWDSTEAFVITGGDGKFEISAQNCNLVVYVPATAIDQDTGISVGRPYTMLTPKGSEAFISPLTTLVQARSIELREQNTTIDLARQQAVAEIQSATGLSNLNANYLDTNTLLVDAAKAHNTAKILAQIYQDPVSFPIGKANAIIKNIQSIASLIPTVDKDFFELQPLLNDFRFKSVAYDKARLTLVASTLEGLTPAQIKALQSVIDDVDVRRNATLIDTSVPSFSSGQIDWHAIALEKRTALRKRLKDAQVAPKSAELLAWYSIERQQELFDAQEDFEKKMNDSVQWTSGNTKANLLYIRDTSLNAANAAINGAAFASGIAVDTKWLKMTMENRAYIQKVQRALKFIKDSNLMDKLAASKDGYDLIGKVLSQEIKPEDLTKDQVSKIVKFAADLGALVYDDFSNGFKLISWGASTTDDADFSDKAESVLGLVEFGGGLAHAPYITNGAGLLKNWFEQYNRAQEYEALVGSEEQKAQKQIIADFQRWTKDIFNAFNDNHLTLLVSDYVAFLPAGSCEEGTWEINAGNCMPLNGNYSIVASDPMPLLSETITFKIDAAVDYVKSVVWKVGDTIMQTLNGIAEVFTHIFQTIGEFVVSATLQNQLGQEVAYTSITVNTQFPLIASLEGTTTTAYVGQDVSIVWSNSSAKNEAKLCQFSIDFGNGLDGGGGDCDLIGQIDKIPLTTQYTQAGEYTIRLTVKDSEGRTANTTWTVVVQPALVFQDNFNDNINGVTAGNWTAVVEGTNPSVQEANQRLEVTLPANSLDGSKLVFEAGYQSTCQLQGDFDVQTDYNLLDFPQYNGVRVGLTVGARVRQSSILYTITRTSLSLHEGGLAASEVVGVNFTTANGSITDVVGNTAGTLRLERVGNTLRGYRYNNNSWQLLDSATVTTDALPVTISAWSHNDRFDNKTVKVAFDNFKVTKGALVGASCKVTSVAEYPTRWYQSIMPPPKQSNQNLVYTVTETGDMACATYNGIDCLWGSTFSQIDFTKVKLLICGTSHLQTLYATDGYSDPQHWCSITKQRYVNKQDTVLYALSGRFDVPATSSAGIAFASPSSTKPLQCSFTSTGLASERTTKVPYINPNGVSDGGVFPLLALIAKHADGTSELVGSNGSLSVKPNETLKFLAYDDRWDDNSGQFDVTYTCSEIPQPTWATNTANGHQYAAVDCGTWTQCEAQAVALGAHLVSVNDAAENAWLVSTFTPTKNYWIGLTDKDQEGVWKWTSGEAFGYSNWAANEPNNMNDEDAVQLIPNSGRWNDGPTNTKIDGFVGIFEKSSSSNYSVEWHYPNIGTLITGRGTNPVSVITSDAVEVTGFMDNAKFDVDVIGNKVKLFNFRSYSGYPNAAIMTTASFNGFVLRAVNGAFSSATIAIDNNGDGDYLDAGELAPASSKITIGADYIAANLSGLSYSPTTVMYIDFQPL